MTNRVSYLTELHHLLSRYFNLTEIHNLCIQLNVDFESVAGEEKPSRIRELLLALGRNGRLPELVSLLQQERPRVDWPLVPDDFELPESLIAAGTAVAANEYHVYGDAVQGGKVEGDRVGGDKINVGDISHSSGIAIGRGSRASVHVRQETAVEELNHLSHRSTG